LSNCCKINERISALEKYVDDTPGIISIFFPEFIILWLNSKSSLLGTSSLNKPISSNTSLLYAPKGTVDTNFGLSILPTLKGESPTPILLDSVIAMAWAI
jgi:hypothetical protein